MVVNLGIIGYRKHAEVLRNLLEKKTDCTVSTIFHPDKKLDIPKFTNTFSDLFSNDAIIIASPNHTHFDYMKKLFSEFTGYVFCEKPPVTNLLELEELKTLSNEKKQKLFFNFNFRFSHLNHYLTKYSNSKELGKLFYINIISNHGLAFKPEYITSWRSDGKNNLHNILNTVSIHFLDLINLCFSEPDFIHYFPNNISGNGTAFDTCTLILKYNSGLTVSILNSYSSSLQNDLQMIGTNGFLKFQDQNLNVFSPRDTFDSMNRFTYPPLIHKELFNFQKDYRESLVTAMDYFISKVKSNDKIDLKYFDSSIVSNQQILNLEKNQN